MATAHEIAKLDVVAGFPATMNLMDPPERFEGKAETSQLLYASLRSACPHWREQERGELLVSKGETFEMVAS